MVDFIGKYCIVRTLNAGVFAGIVECYHEKEAMMSDARRIWYWSGAASLSEMANRGVKRPQECKFPGPVQVLLTGVIEILPCTECSQASIRGVPEWKA